jgi:hypothetical protein
MTLLFEQPADCGSTAFSIVGAFRETGIKEWLWEI